MKLLLKIVAALVGLFVILMVVQGVASEQGEVVVLTTMDSGGEARTTRVWVVDLDGDAWLRSGSPGSGWYRRVSENPLVRVMRNGAEFTATAIAVPDKQAQVNALMAEKYGFADRLIGVMFDRDDAIPLRLDRVH